MCKDTHIVASCALLLAVSLPFGSVEIPMWIPSIHHSFDIIVATLTCIFGAALPDIDTAKFQGKNNLAAKLFPVHRGITHSLIFPIALFVLASQLRNIVAASAIFGVAFGWLAHVIEDCFNKKGCPLLMPFSRKHFHIATFVSNSFISKKKRLEKNRNAAKKSPFYKTEGAFLWLWLCICIGVYKLI